MTDNSTRTRFTFGKTALKIGVLLFVLVTAAWFLYRNMVIADSFPGL